MIKRNLLLDYGSEKKVLYPRGNPLFQKGKWFNFYWMSSGEIERGYSDTTEAGREYPTRKFNLTAKEYL